MQLCRVYLEFWGCVVDPSGEKGGAASAVGQASVVHEAA
jgi:hypothetical protein